MEKLARPSRLFTLIVGCLLLPQTSMNGGEIVQQKGCNVVGRVITSGDPGITQNSVLCENGSLVVSEGEKAYISCYKRSENVWVESGTHSTNRLCSDNRDVRSTCWIEPCTTRSNGNIALLHPRTSTVLKTPTLRWSDVPEAQYYEIFVSSSGENTFQVKTNEPQFDVSNYYSLNPGNIYRIDIYAVAGSEILEKSRFSLKVPTEEEISTLYETIQIAESSSIPEEDKIQIIDAAYMTLGLTDHSLAYLESANQKLDSFIIVALIADRFAELGYREQAKKNYQIVSENAPETSSDFIFAQKMLAKIERLEDSKASFP